MPRIKYTNISDVISQIKSDIENDTNNLGKKKYIPDIITFCNSPDYLNLLERGIVLRPFQEIILKIFYRGSVGNENIVLTKKEIQTCKDNGLFDGDRGDALNKYYESNIFRELVLVWGRRAGKDFVGSLIATYEAMKLLECPGGDPYAVYGISSAATINILTVATAKDQADTAFKEIKDRILGSRYFKDKMMPEGLETSKIYLLTQSDRIENKDLLDRKLMPKKGSILIEVGHSNSDSLLGKGVFVLILDEVASYKKTGGSSSGERIYTSMSPSLNTYKRVVKVLDANGNEVLNDDGEPKTRIVYDSKIISISSPRGEDGIFYEIYKETPKVESRLACRLPTWAVVPELTEESLRETNSHMTEVQFMMEFGAEFSGMGGENFFPRHCVEECFKPGYKIEKMGKAGVVYFAHLDPATSSHNYSLVIVHREMFFNKKTSRNDFNIVVDHIKHWHPTPDTPINTEIIDDYIIGLRKKFYFGVVTYDIWNSLASINKLRKFGIPAKCTHFSKKYKMTIYDELYNLVISGRLRIPPYALLRDEMFNLQRKFIPPSGYSVFPKREGEVSTDDIVDSLAGACYNSISFAVKKLPNGQVIDMGIMHGTNNRMWNSMSGPIGYGSGQQVADKLERLHSWPNSQRR